MSKRRIMRCGADQRTPGRERPVAGFTLIELMIAMVLGLIVIAGVVSVFLASQQSYRTNQALGDVQDGSRIAFEMMARDIRDAGLTGCDNGGRVANVLKNSPTGGSTPAWWADWSNAVHGYDDTQTDPAATIGAALNQRVTGTDSLELLGAADSGLSVAATPSSSAANFHINDPSSGLIPGDVIMVCDPDHATIVQVTGPPSGNQVVVHNPGGSTSPGNCSKGMGYPTVCTPNGNGYTFGANSQIFKLGASDWYIGNYDTTGGRSLYRVNVATNAGVPAATAQEMVRDVTNMQITYHQTPNTNFVAAASITDWSKVDAARVQLTLESTDKRAGTDVKPVSRSFTATTTIRNRVK